MCSITSKDYDAKTLAQKSSLRPSWLATGGMLQVSRGHVTVAARKLFNTGKISMPLPGTAQHPKDGRESKKLESPAARS
jgi:hypothetical protein